MFKRFNIFCNVLLIFAIALTLTNSIFVESKQNKNTVKVKKKVIAKNVDYVHGNYFKKNGKWFCIEKNSNEIKRMFPEEFEKNVKKIIFLWGGRVDDYNFVVLGKDGKFWSNIDCFETSFCFNYKYEYNGFYSNLPDDQIERVKKTYEDITIEKVANENYEWNLVLFEEDVEKVWITEYGSSIAFIKYNCLYTYGIEEVPRDGGPTGNPDEYFDNPPPNLVEYDGINVDNIKKVFTDNGYVYILMKSGIFYRIIPYQRPREMQDINDWWFRKECSIKRKHIIKKKVKDAFATDDYQVYVHLKNGNFGKINKYGEIKKPYKNIKKVCYFYKFEKDTELISKNKGKKGVRISGDIYTWGSSNRLCKNYIPFDKGKKIMDKVKTVCGIYDGDYNVLATNGTLYRLEFV